ncbi:hypothetical protein D3C83_46970 [compost metagenome]
MWPLLPAPAVPATSWPGFFFASAMKSWMLEAGTLAGTASMLSPTTSEAISVKERTGSYSSFCSAGWMVCAVSQTSSV